MLAIVSVKNCHFLYRLGQQGQFKLIGGFLFILHPRLGTNGLTATYRTFPCVFWWVNCMANLGTQSPSLSLDSMRLRLVTLARFWNCSLPSNQRSLSTKSAVNSRLRVSIWTNGSKSEASIAAYDLPSDIAPGAPALHLARLHCSFLVASLNKDCVASNSLFKPLLFE